MRASRSSVARNASSSSVSSDDSESEASSSLPSFLNFSSTFGSVLVFFPRTTKKELAGRVEIEIQIRTSLPLLTLLVMLKPLRILAIHLEVPGFNSGPAIIRVGIALFEEGLLGEIGRVCEGRNLVG